MYLHVHAYVCAYICVCMHAWKYEHLGACTCVFICTLMCVRMHACMYIFCNIPPQVLKLASLAPPPPLNIEKLPTHMSQAFLGHRLKHKIILLSFLKVRNDAKISNRYTQVPHLTHDTPSGSEKTQ